MFRKRNPCTLLVGMSVGASTMENSMEVPEKTKNRATVQSNNSIPGYLAKENENTKLKRERYIYIYIYIYTPVFIVF